MAVHFKSLLLVLLLALFTFSVSGQLIASINCGGSDVMIDLNLITWSPDDTMVSNGDARVVQSSYSISPLMDSLRVFTTRKKNCYSIGPKLQGEKVLVRASFNYGNYDRLSSPPTFELHFDGNFWTTVRTTISGGIYYETTYVAKGDYISVCVAQTKPGQFPFMSTLEVRRFDAEVYSEVDKNRALFLKRRVSYGASKILRYPSDSYDRIWRYPTDTMETVANEAIFVDTTNSPNNPPSGIFQNAMTAASTTDTLFLGMVSPLDGPIYANMYFSEVTYLGLTLKRSFRIYDSSTLASNWLTSSILPPYGSVVEKSFYNYSVNSNTNIYMIATSDSDLPPLINAMEVFYISEVLTDGTNSNDVKALAMLQSTFAVLGGWSGDPCLPASYSWEWLSCSNDATPRVTSLYLASFNLSGSLPDISLLDALEIIDLHNNSLTGTIPSFLGTMPDLQQLNLADNQFSGPVPTSLSNNNKLKLTVSGNPSLCTSGKSCSSSPGTINSSPGSTTVSTKKRSSMLPIILGITIPIFLLIWIVVGALIIFRRKTKPANANMPVITRGSGVNSNSREGANGNPEVGQGIREEMVNEVMENIVQQAVVTPSAPDTSSQNSNIYGQNPNRETRNPKPEPMNTPKTIQNP